MGRTPDCPRRRARLGSLPLNSAGRGTALAHITRRVNHDRDHRLEFFAANFGPVKVAVETLDDAGREALAADTKAVVERFNRAGERSLIAPGEYLEVVATRA